MELKNYYATFRNVLLEAVEEKIGTIYLSPHAMSPWNKLYKVIKVGKDCQEIQEGDHVYIGMGVNPNSRTIEGKTYYTVFEQQIEGKFTIPVTDWEEFTEKELEAEPFEATVFAGTNQDTTEKRTYKT